MAERNPFYRAQNIAEITITVIVLALVASAAIYGFVVMPIQGEWGVWFALGFFAVLFVVLLGIGWLWETGARKWRNAARRWEREHSEEVS